MLRGGSGPVALDVAALQIATIEDPHLTIEPFLGLLDSHAAEFRERVTPSTPGDEFVLLFNEYLFEELGFQGNTDDYYDPANSCLNEVLTRRLGIPITLSVMYMEVARRLGRKVHGIGLPGHFLVRFDADGFESFIDPFNEGRVLPEDECFALARDATGMPLQDDSAMLRPVSNRVIAIRMLNNLRSVYFRRRQPARAVQVLDLLIDAAPESADEYKQRGICLAQVDRFTEARSDLETYLRLSPEAADRAQVSLELSRIRRMIALQP